MLALHTDDHTKPVYSCIILIALLINGKQAELDTFLSQEESKTVSREMPSTLELLSSYMVPILKPQLTHLPTANNITV